jgi:tRNA-dihydrouridine synthase
VAVARGALGNPWIFREAAEYINNGEVMPRPAADEIAETIIDHLDANIAFNGERIGVIRFRKFFAWYTRGLPVKELKVRAFRACSRDEMLQLIGELARCEKEKVSNLASS